THSPPADARSSAKDAAPALANTSRRPDSAGAAGLDVWGRGSHANSYSQSAISTRWARRTAGRMARIKLNPTMAATNLPDSTARSSRSNVGDLSAAPGRRLAQHHSAVGGGLSTHSRS